MSNRPVILLGAGGHAKVVLDILQLHERAVLGVVDPVLDGQRCNHWRGLPVLGDDDAVAQYSVNDIELVNGVGAMPGQQLRRRLHGRFKSLGYSFATLVHPAAVIGYGVTMGQGVQVMAGVVVQADTQIGEDVILNTGARVDHDCRIADHVHVAPGAVLSGGVRVEDRGHIGPGATIIQNIHLGADVIVGSGTTVLADIPKGHQQTGQPPRLPTPNK